MGKYLWRYRKKERIFATPKSEFSEEFIILGIKGNIDLTKANIKENERI